MKPHPKLRKAVKWGGFLMCVVLVAVWVVSIRGTPTRANESGLLIGVESGIAFAARAAVPTPGESGGFDWWMVDEPTLRWWPHQFPAGYGWNVQVPLWIPAICCLLLGFVAWFHEACAKRRAREGACAKCGYDLAGLAEGGMCAECGT